MNLRNWIEPGPWLWGRVAEGNEQPEPPAPAQQPQDAAEAHRTDDTREG